MKIDLHDYVDLRADFHRPDSIDEPTGGELAAIVAAGIAQRDIRVTKTEAVDYANYVECELGTSSIELMVGAEFLDGANDRWYVQPHAKLFCPKRTLSFIYVLAFNSAEEREKLDVESEVFYA